MDLLPYNEGPPDEIWRFVPEFNNYIVSNYGNVYNVVRQKFTDGWLDRSVPRIRLTQDGRYEKFYIHILVASLYLEDYKEGYLVRHIDGNKKNTHISNLEQTNTHVESLVEYRGGRLVRAIELDEVFPNARVAAMELELDVATIYKCLRGERDRHLGLTFEYAD